MLCLLGMRHLAEATLVGRLVGPDLGRVYNHNQAVVSALTRAVGAGSEVIWSDSLYAINMTTGKWRPKCTRNREIVARLRGVRRRLQRARPREVQLQHVRSHIKVPGNELANWLADNGRMSDRKGVTEATRWMRAWMTRQRMSATGQHAGNHGAGPAQIGSPGSSGDG